MFTVDNSKPFISRFSSYLKLGVLFVLLGLIAVATERPTLLTPAGAMTVASNASHVAQRAKARTSTSAPAAQAAATPAADRFVYFPSQFSERSGAGDDLPAQF
ncbi:MAG TPA: hypothetical protein VGK37_14020 [Casimicrobiaceae bacterium]|jgi:hypothetical protein